MKVIHNTRQLRRAIARGQYDYAILLAGGAVRSSKNIETDGEGRFTVWNLIDDTQQFLTGRELYTQSNLGEARRKGAFIED
jgi:hypothetical protein